MESYRIITRGLGIGLLLASSTLLASTHYHANQLEAIVGINHASHSYSNLHTGDGASQESDALHSDSANNDVTWGFSYAYNVLHRPYYGLQHLLLGVDWLFFNTTDSGDAYQYGYNSMANYRYNANFQTARLLANSEFDFISPWDTVFPYLQFSMGGARINADYSDTPIDGSLGGGQVLHKKTNYNFTYAVGAGVKYLIIPNFQVSVSYLYTNFGVVEFEDDRLEDRLVSSSGLLGFTYLFL